MATIGRLSNKRHHLSAGSIRLSSLATFTKVAVGVMSFSRSLGRLVNGRLDLSSRNLNSEDLAKIPVIPQLTELVLDNNQIETFESLRAQPNLRVVSAVNNPVRYLNGLSEQLALTDVDLTNTEVTAHSKFRELTVATIGSQLTILNGTPVTEQERDVAATLSEKKPDELFLSKAESEPDEVDTKIKAVYLNSLRPTFSTFAYNRAVLLDLTENKKKKVPVVDAATTNEQLDWAITRMKERNAVLKGIIRDKRRELGVEPLDD
jgi:hypothetical protein